MGKTGSRKGEKHFLHTIFYAFDCESCVYPAKTILISFDMLLYLFVPTQDLFFLVTCFGAPFMRPNIGLVVDDSAAPEIQAPIVRNNAPNINTT